MASLLVGDRVHVKNEPGTIRYIGRASFAPGNWVGVELDNPTGKNNGTIQGTKYFDCSKDGNYGVFVRPNFLTGGKTLQPVDRQDAEKIVLTLQSKLKVARLELGECKKQIEVLQTELDKKSGQFEDLEMKLEGALVDQNYLKDRNVSLAEQLESLKAKYNDISADYAILQEEAELNKELELAVQLQAADGEGISDEDLRILVQRNQKLEVALHSLQRLSTERETALRSEVIIFKNQLSEVTELRKSYSTVSAKLNEAEDAIKELQDQLESASGLELVIEHLTHENETLQIRINELSRSVTELTELNDLNTSLEEFQLNVELQLKSQIAALLSEVEIWKDKFSVISNRNEELQRSINEMKSRPQLMSDENSGIEELILDVKKLSTLLNQNKLELKAVSGELHVKNNLLDLVVPPFLAHKFQVLTSLKNSVSQCDIIENYFKDTFPNHNLKDLVLLIHLRHHVLTLIALVVFSDCITIPPWESLHLAAANVSQGMQEVFEKVKNDDPEFLDFSFVDNVVRDHPFVLERIDYADLNVSLILLDLATHASISFLIICRIFDEFFFNQQQSGDIFQSLKELQNVSSHVSSRAHSLYDSSLHDPNWQISTIEVDKLNSLLLELYYRLREEASYFSSDERKPDQLLSLISQAVSLGLPLKERTQDFEKFLAVLSGETKKTTTNLKPFYSNFIECSQPISQETKGDSNSFRDQTVEELQHNIELLENNMESLIKTSDASIKELQKQLLDAKMEVSDLLSLYKSVKEENKVIQTELEMLFRSNSMVSHQQIPFFEDLKAKMQFTTEAALIEEISTLKEMVLYGIHHPKRSMKDLGWLKHPLMGAACFATSLTGQKFVMDARNRREWVVGLLRSIERRTDSGRTT